MTLSRSRVAASENGLVGITVGGGNAVDGIFNYLVYPQTYKLPAIHHSIFETASVTFIETELMSTGK